MEKQKDGRLSPAQTRLIKPVERAKDRAKRLDEIDEESSSKGWSSDIESLFDNPEE